MKMTVLLEVDMHVLQQIFLNCVFADLAEKLLSDSPTCQLFPYKNHVCSSYGFEQMPFMLHHPK